MPTILLSNNTIKGYAGSELITLDLATEFKHRGYDVTIATFGKDTSVVKSLDELDVKWLDLNTVQPNAEKIVFDLIWAHHFTTLDAILMDLEITAKAIIFSSMSPYEPLESPPTYASQLSLVLANSEETRNQLLHYGLPLSMVHVFPNPVAREWFAIAKTASSLPLRKVAVVSNHVVDELQDAIKHLQALGVLVEIFGVEHNFKQVTPTLLASFDCVVTIGRTVQQAMVLGLPVYCYDRFGGPGYLRTENFEKAGLFNYSGRCCECFKTAEEIATELVDGYQSAVTAAPDLQLIAHERYRLDSAVSHVLEIIADNTLDLSIISTALKLPLRMRKHAKNSELNQLFAQLFFDNGTGISESRSIRIPLNGIQASQSSRDLVFDLPDNHSLVNLRLDPLNSCTVITIHRAELLGPEGSVDLTDCIKTNAKDCSDNTHFFIDDDPQIFFAGATFNGATHLKVSLTYQATGSEALKKFITQHEMRFASLINVADSEQNYNQISRQLIENQAKSFTPIKEELIARIHEIASLNQQTSKRDEEISSINQVNVEREQVHLAQLSKARQQIEAQLLQLAEREKASSEQLQQMQQVHEQQKSEQSREHAEREQAHLALLGQARQQIETQLLQLAEREKAFSEQLQQMQQAHEQQKSEQSREHAEREQANLAQLGQARQQIETQLLQLAEREKAFSEQLQQLRQAHEQQKSEQSRDHAEHEQAHLAQLGQARQQIENQLHQLAEREKAFSEQLLKLKQAHEQQRGEQNREHAEREKTQLSQLTLARQQIAAYVVELTEREKTYAQHLQEIQQTHERQKNEQGHKHAEREKVHLAHLALARQKLETHLLKLADREKKFSQQLQAIRQTSDQRKREHSNQLAERDKAFSRQLQEIQQAHEQQKGEQSREHAEREQAYLAKLGQAREEIETHLLELAAREKAFSNQLQAMHLAHEQQKNAQAQQHAEREQAHIEQLTLARQQIEAHLLQLAERERAFSEQLQKVQQTHEQQISTQSQQHAEREQALNDQLAARQHELRSQINRWAETEKAHALAVNELHRELNAIRGTFSWRWTAPLRSVATLLSKQTVDTPQAVTALNEILPKTTVLNAEAPANLDIGMHDVNLRSSDKAAKDLKELLSYESEVFIQKAYLTILGRPADPGGFIYYLQQLEINNSKLAIVIRLRLSEEGKQRKIDIPEIDNVIEYQKFFKNPIIGACLSMFGISREKKMILKKLLSIENNLNSHNDRTQAELNSLEKLVKRLESRIEESISNKDKNQYTQLANFEPNWYIKNYPDVQESGINPFEHYILYGINEGREYSSKKVDLQKIEIINKINPEPGTKVHQISTLEDTCDKTLSKLVKLICFYLPQYHPIPENNSWWGEGFTEWTNVKPAKAQFKDHYQPRMPHELGYYNLLDRATQHRQVELAKTYGIEGFCFYFYWFGGSRLLEKPVENYLKDSSLTLPFCLCWANENWSRRWDGLESEVLIAQQHSPEDDIAFIESVSDYMKDPRYIKINGRPLLLVYRPSLLPSAKETVERWRTKCRENGIGEIYLAYTQSFEKSDPLIYGFDAAIEFPPNNSNIPNVTKDVQPLVDDFDGNVYDWTALVDRSNNYETPNYTLFRGVCPSWDNTARRKNNGSILVNSSPHKYQEWLCNSIYDTTKRLANPDERLVFINAWNEWAEGAYLEPDERYGYAYLEATRMAQFRCSIQHETATVKNSLKVKNEAMSLAIVIHAFYTDVLQEIISLISNVSTTQLHLYVTCPSNIKEEVSHILDRQNMKYDIIVVKNKGRDVLPFLKVMPEILKNKHHFLVKVHTKKSKHRVDGDRWRKELYEQLITENAIATGLEFLECNPKVGILGPVGHVVPMNYYFGSNIKHVHAIANRLGMGSDELQSLNFVAGTMFTARVSAILPLLSIGLKDEDFEEEDGQVDGTLAHGIERALSVSAWSTGMSVATLTEKINNDYDFAAKTIVK